MANHDFAKYSEVPAFLRYQNIIAERAGLSVTFDTESNMYAWSGTKEQFLATGLFNPSQNWDFKHFNKAINPVGMRAEIKREATRLKLFQRVDRFFDTALPSTRGRIMINAIAKADSDYQRFRAAMLTTVIDIPEAD